MIEKIKTGISKQNNKALDIHHAFAKNISEIVTQQGLSKKHRTMLQSMNFSDNEAFKKTFSESVNLTKNLVQMIKQLEHTYYRVI